MNKKIDHSTDQHEPNNQSHTSMPSNHLPATHQLDDADGLPVKPAAASNLLPICIVCNRTPAQGIRGGFLILQKFLCTRCEADIAGLTLEHPRYEQVKEQLKKLWN
ncbi:MAG: hypothetical protein HPY81_05360 [Firmicutes bacterium]|nr:hypothetical protein [Bacillota bacterium]